MGDQSDQEKSIKGSNRKQ